MEMFEGAISTGFPDQEERPIKPQYRVKLKGLILLKVEIRSDKDIGRRIGFNPNFVQQVMSGKVYPSSSMQRAFCALLGIKMKELRALL
jgi:hypothetical protein